MPRGGFSTTASTSVSVIPDARPRIACTSIRTPSGFGGGLEPGAAPAAGTAPGAGAMRTMAGMILALCSRDTPGNAKPTLTCRAETSIAGAAAPAGLFCMV